jgi:two-component system response regulator FixJ
MIGVAFKQAHNAVRCNMSEVQIVHIVEGDPAVRESLTLLIKSAGLVPQAYASAREFLDTNSPPTGCVISDIRMTGTTGLDMLADLRARRVWTPVILMTAYADVPMAVKAMKLGAFDFIEKPFDDELMISTVRAALDRRGDSRAGDAEGLAAREKLASLTGREKDVLSGLLKGKLNKVIAHELGISVRTVETYRANVMIKTQAQSLSELVKLSLMAAAAPEDA